MEPTQTQRERDPARWRIRRGLSSGSCFVVETCIYHQARAIGRWAYADAYACAQKRNSGASGDCTSIGIQWDGREVFAVVATSNWG